MSNKELSYLLADIASEKQLHEVADLDISNIHLDSRLITKNGLFVALNGAQTDGRLYINKAIEHGAVAVLVEANDSVFNEQHYEIPVIKISNLNAHLSDIASRFYNFPQRQLKLIGITGTNGKTTVNQLIGQWLTLMGKKAYCMGTLGNGLYGDLVDSPNTTLNAIDLIAHLDTAKRLGADYVVMEVSSHGLALDRVKSLHFDVAAFTNLTQDHLDLHGTMKAYADAKLQLFTPAYSDKIVINGRDDVAKIWIKQWQTQQREMQLCCFGHAHPMAQDNVLTTDVIYSNKGISASLSINDQIFKLQSPLLGAFNLDNLLTAFSCLHSAGFSAEKLMEHLSLLSPVAGRMEVFTNDNSPGVVVDYAHTPDALKQALTALRQHCSGQLWVVFGCGGDRDAKKRPLMAAMAEQYADMVIFTQDNSRSESPSFIFSQMLEGINNTDAITIEHERMFAVKYAIEHAKKQDIVLLAGKGHENYQILQCGRVDYDERALAQKMVDKYL
jgi:UDP-N-acetylmuramoyl-L-alanyl-D-glutamate--2,6-diaminopimelate ligase